MSLEFSLTVSHRTPFSPGTMYQAWTAGWATWFAEPDSIHMQPIVGAPFHFDVVQRFEDNTPVTRHPHYGRFLQLDPNSVVALTWVTNSTGGAETTLTVAFTPDADGTIMTLTHAGFMTEAARDQHAAAWPMVLAQQEATLRARPDAAPSTPAALWPTDQSPTRRLSRFAATPISTKP